MIAYSLSRSAAPAQRKGRRRSMPFCRFIKPAGCKLGTDFVDWKALRTSWGTCVVKYLNADIKDAQALMRHFRASTTLDIYAQHIPES